MELYFFSHFNFLGSDVFLVWLAQAASLAMDESILDADQVENLIKFCPTKEEMELLKVRSRTYFAEHHSFNWEF